MSPLFKKKTKEVENVPPPQPAQARPEQPTILNVSAQIQKLQAELDAYNAERIEEDQLAAEYVNQRNDDMARQHLVMRKQYQTEMMAIEEQIITLQQAETQSTSIITETQIAEILKQKYANFDVEKLADDIEDIMAKKMEVDREMNSINNMWAEMAETHADEDEDALLAEFKAQMNEEQITQPQIVPSFAETQQVEQEPQKRVIEEVL